MSATAYNTRARSDALAAVADEIIQAAGGVEKLDQIPQTQRPAKLRELNHKMVASTGCHLDTAKKHIAKSIRRQRHPDDPPLTNNWGGSRGGGRPPKKDNKTMISIQSVDTIPEHDPYHEGQCTPTTTALWIDPRDNTAGVSQELDDNATPMDEYHSRIITKSLDDDYRPDEDALKTFLEGIQGQELLAEICAAHSIEWDGNNLVGEMGDEGWNALAALIDEIDALPSHQWGLWQAEEWLHDYAAEYIDADTTPAKIAELAAEIEVEAKDDYIILDEDIGDFLSQYQSELGKDN